jgi:hypothetical protein
VSNDNEHFIPTSLILFIRNLFPDKDPIEDKDCFSITRTHPEERITGAVLLIWSPHRHIANRNQISNSLPRRLKIALPGMGARRMRKETFVITRNYFVASRALLLVPATWKILD